MFNTKKKKNKTKQKKKNLRMGFLGIAHFFISHPIMELQFATLLVLPPLL
jgi:hypothetical protein